jgi:hypothetical protein
MSQDNTIKYKNTHISFVFTVRKIITDEPKKDALFFSLPVIWFPSTVILESPIPL